MPTPTTTAFAPRKQPVQARSTASVDAILGATLQVLLQVGASRLTTTRVAARAGVSVGTLYQYFPNKSALLQATLKRHLEEVQEAVEHVCRTQTGAPLEDMAHCLINAFLEAKMRHPAASASLYSVSSDVDGARIAAEMQARLHKAIAAMLHSSINPLPDASLAAAMLQGAMVGVSRRLLESPNPAAQLETLRQELIFLTRTYLTACAARPDVGL